MSVWKDPKTGKWRYKLQHLGRRLEGKGYRTRAEAKEAETIRLASAKTALHLRTNTISLGALANMYLDDCKDRMQGNTVRQKTFVFRSFISFLQNDPPANEIPKEKFVGYLRQRKAGGKTTANRDLRDLQALYNWGISHEVKGVSKNPCQSIPKFPEDPFMKYLPPIEDIKAVKLVAKRDEQDFIETIYHGFARRAEVRRLTWDDVNFERTKIRFTTRKRKGGQLEEIIKPMNRTLAGVLQSRWQRRDKSSPYVFQFEQKQLDRMMPDLCKRAGVKPFGFHSIRHFVASALKDAGKNVKAVQELLGHKRLSTTEIYLHTLGEGLRDAAEALDEQEKNEVALGVVTHTKLVGNKN